MEVIMTVHGIDLEKDLTYRDREYLRLKHHEWVKDMFCDAYVYPFALCVGFWCLMSVLEMIV